MDALRQQVAVAYRRLLMQRFFSVLAWSLFGTLIVAGIAIGVTKAFPLNIDPVAWTAWWITGAVVLGFFVAGVWTYMTRQGRLDAALEIDRRFGLKERVSSTLALEPDELQTEAGRALASDAVRRVERIDVTSKFPIQLSRRSLLPLVPAAVLLGLLFVSDPTREDQAEGNLSAAKEAKLIKESTSPLPKKLSEHQKEAAEKGLTDAAELFKQLEQGARELTKKDDINRKQALSKLTDLQKQLEERREKLGGAERMKEQLDNLKNLKSGPADKVANALKEGDFQKALDEIEKLKQELAKGDLDDKQKGDLEKQLADMQQKLQEAVNGQKKMEGDLEKKIADLQKQIPNPDQLKKQIQELLDQGRKEDADKLRQQADRMAANLDKMQQQLNKMQQQGPQMKQLQDLANKLGQCAHCMANGDKAGAAQALDGMQQELAQMQMQGEELKMLDLALDQIAECKGDCNGEGDKIGMGGKGKGKGNGKGDFAQGEGQGEGKRDIAKDDVGFRESHVSQNIGKGKAVITGEADGPNIKGLVHQQIQQQIETARRESTDAVTRQRLPRSQRDHAKEYFDALREGR